MVFSDMMQYTVVNGYGRFSGISCRLCEITI
jgi:hypothetical protein